MYAGAFNRLEASNESLDETDFELLDNLMDEDCVVFQGGAFCVRVRRETYGLITLSVFPFQCNRLAHYPVLSCSYNVEQKCFVYQPYPSISFLRAFLNGYSFMN